MCRALRHTPYTAFSRMYRTCPVSFGCLGSMIVSAAGSRVYSFNGRAYPLGARVGPSVCIPNGTSQPPPQQPQPHVQQPQLPPPSGQQPDANQNVTVSALSSKQAACPSGAQIMVAVQDLQEMHNHFREQIDAGLKTLAE